MKKDKCWGVIWIENNVLVYRNNRPAVFENKRDADEWRKEYCDNWKRLFKVVPVIINYKIK